MCSFWFTFSSNIVLLTKLIQGETVNLEVSRKYQVPVPGLNLMKLLGAYLGA